MRKIIVAVAMMAFIGVAAAQSQSCQFTISRHGAISCQFSSGPVYVQPGVLYQQTPLVIYGQVPPPAWTQAPVFQQVPPVVIYQEPQVIYVQPQQHYRGNDYPYQPNPNMPYYQPNPYKRNYP